MPRGLRLHASLEARTSDEGITNRDSVTVDYMNANVESYGPNRKKRPKFRRKVLFLRTREQRIGAFRVFKDIVHQRLAKSRSKDIAAHSCNPFLPPPRQLPMSELITIA